MIQQSPDPHPHIHLSIASNLAIGLERHENFQVSLGSISLTICGLKSNCEAGT
jgi:hypothetical protein